MMLMSCFIVREGFKTHVALLHCILVLYIYIMIVKKTVYQTYPRLVRNEKHILLVQIIEIQLYFLKKNH